MNDELPFWKYHGLGNDFVVVQRQVSSEDAKALCHRRLGIGADGVLVVDRSSVTVINADGSEAEICGNGLRCVALHVHEEARHGDGRYRFETGAGPRQCVIVDHPRPGVAVVEVEMGRPTLERRQVPVVGEGEMIEELMNLDGRDLTVTAVGMGNPHAVIFGNFTEDDVVTIGPKLERHPSFPAGVNVGFASMEQSHRIRLTVWERGAGLTGACGSGACAATVAACVTDRAERGTPIVVNQPGGELTITVSADLSQVLMTGPARRAFSGHVELELIR